MKCTIIVPSSLTSVFVPVMKESGLDSTGVSQICEQSLTARGKHSPSRIWLRKWKTDSWMKPLFSQMSQISHGQTTLRTWLEGFCLSDGLANQSPAPESEKPQRTNDGCSTSSQTEFPFSNPECSSQRMSKDSSLQGCQTDQAFSGIASRDWKAYITRLRQEYSLRAKSAHHTRESGCSSWPSASSRDWKDTPGMAREATDWDGSHRNRTDQLARAVYGEEFPLPQTADLTKKQENLGTPVQSAVLNTAEIANALVQPKMNTITRSLTECFTPEKNKHGPPAPANPSTDGSRPESWATPNGRDWKDNGTTLPPSIGETRGFSLGQQMVMTPTPGKLNPRWVETLMGLPVGWVMPSCASPVTIAPTSCDSWEMVSYRPQQSEHSES
jgi:hypothetical protein